MDLNTSMVHGHFGSNSTVPHCPTIRTLPYELNTEFEDARKFLDENYRIPIVSAVVYVFGIYYGQKFMVDRKPYNLKMALFLWNALLAVFSLFGSFRVLQDLFHVVTHFSLHSTICVTGPCAVRGFWISVFSLSKVLELGDTAFIILRKRRLIFLHPYHHISVLFFTWAACAEGASFGRYFMGVNFMVHTMMYTYYALCSLGIRPHRIISMSVTSLQIIQMVIGMFVVGYAYRQLGNGVPCDVKPTTIRSALVMYASYFVLFVNFFIHAYVKKEPKKRVIQTNGINQNDVNDNLPCVKKDFHRAKFE